MSYRNIEMDTRSERFRKTYESVVDAVAELGRSGEVEVKFLHYTELRVWRRRCYEYQKITGVAFRIEVTDATTLILRPTRRKVDATPLMIAGKPIEQLREELEKIPDEITPEQQKYIDEIVGKATGEHEHLSVKEIFGGSHDDDSGRSNSGGDGTSNGSPGGDD